MNYLHIDEDGGLAQTQDEPSDEVIDLIDQSALIVVRFSNGKFESAAVHAVDDTRSLVWNPV